MFKKKKNMKFIICVLNKMGKYHVSLILLKLVPERYIVTIDIY